MSPQEETPLSPPTLEIEHSPRGAVVRVLGAWRLSALENFSRNQKPLAFADGSPVILDGRGLAALDTAGALLLLGLLPQRGDVELQGFRPENAAILGLVQERRAAPRALKMEALGFFSRVGQNALRGLQSFRVLLSFIGESAVETTRVAVAPGILRLRELVVQLELACIDALPVVGMMMFLIGVVIAYLFASQVEKYGANIFIVDGTAVSLFRELSPVIVAIIVAGRSGSAFTAQLGTMKLNEEIDALITLGLSPMRVLILPRFFALIFALPVLTFLGDVIGLLGAMLVADLRLGITIPTFIVRLHDNIAQRHFIVGLVKAPVFAAFIAIIGCKMGLTVENNARSVGLSTTSTVVQSIVAVILLNAAFAIMFVELGI